MHGVVRQAHLIDPLVDADLCFQLGVALDQVLPQVGDEAGRGLALEGVAGEIGLQISVPARPTDGLLDGAQEGRALLVGDVGHAVVGIAAGQVKVQAGVEPARPAGVGDGGLQVAPAQVGQHVGAGLAVQLLHDPVFEVVGEALVQPEVRPRGVVDQVARPRVRQLVRHQADQRAVAGDDGRGGEGQARVLHAAERERRRQHQQVVAAPGIGPVEALGRRHHLLDIDQLVGRLLHHRRLGIDAGPLAQRREGQVTDRHGDQVRGHRLVHLEAVGARAISKRLAIGRQHLGAHHRLQPLGRDDAGGPGLADAGAVLGGDPAAVQDRLALAEQVGRFLAGRLRRRQPLQGRAAGGAVIADDDAAGAVQRHRQRRAQDRIGLAHAPRQGLALGVGDAVDHQALGVEHDLLGVGSRGDVERRLALHLLRLEVGGQVEINVRHPRDQRLGIGVDVPRLRRLQDRWNGRRRGLRQHGRGDAAEQERQQDGAGFEGHGSSLCERDV